jgi:acyl dehydratase
VNQLPGVKKSGSTLPDLTLTTSGVVDRDKVAAYNAVCGFATRDTAPVPYLHMLAFPLHMALMTDSSFRFVALGMVHLENSISQHRPVGYGEKVDLSLSAANLRPHARGKLFDINVTATVDDEVVWESTSSYLRMGRNNGADKENGGRLPDRGTTFNEVAPGGIPWKLPEDLGRKYGAVSGDRNPIHLYPITARALGFPRHIAHGMWSKARCIAAIENRLPDAVRVEVGFKKPIFLPGTVTFGQQASDTGIDFSLSNPRNGDFHLLGRTTAL